MPKAKKTEDTEEVVQAQEPEVYASHNDYDPA
jgi:hypothetical protein